MKRDEFFKRGGGALGLLLLGTRGIALDQEIPEEVLAEAETADASEIVFANLSASMWPPGLMRTGIDTYRP